MGGINARNADQFLAHFDGMEMPTDSVVPMMLSSIHNDPSLLGSDGDIVDAPNAFMDGDDLVNTISELQSEAHLLPDIDMDAVLPSVLAGGTDDPNLTWL